MPAFYNTDLDDDKVPDGQLTFEGGMFSNAKARRIKPEQCPLLTDAVIDITGEWSSRRGTAYLGGTIGSGSTIRGLGYYRALGLAADFAVACSDTHIYYNNAGVWTQLGSQAFAGTDHAYIVQGGQGQGTTIQDDKLYVVTGGDLYRWNGTVWADLSSPETAKTAPRNISYLCWHTGRLVAAGPNIKTRTADTAAVPDAIYISDVLDVQNWGTTTYDTQIRVGGGDGADITAVTSWKDFNLAVFKRHSTWVVNADPQFAISDMPVQKVSDNVGCIAHHSAVQVGNDVVFLADDGVRSLSQVLASDQQHELEPPLSFPIGDYISRINWAYAGNAAGIYWRNLYLLAVPLDSSTTNNFVFALNTLQNVWSGIWTNLPIDHFAISKGAVPKLIMSLENTNAAIEYLDWVNESDATAATYQDYNGFLVLPTLITHEMAFGDEKAFKKGAEYEIEWNKSQGGATITPILDDKEVEPDTMDMSSGGFAFPFSLPLNLPTIGTLQRSFDLMRHPSFRGLKLKIETTGTGKKQMRQVIVKAFPESEGPLFGVEGPVFPTPQPPPLPIPPPRPPPPRPPPIPPPRRRPR